MEPWAVVAHPARAIQVWAIKIAGPETLSLEALRVVSTAIGAVIPAGLPFENSPVEGVPVGSVQLIP